MILERIGIPTGARAIPRGREAQRESWMARLSFVADPCECIDAIAPARASHAEAYP
jgi:hypothetical protein